MSVGDIWQEHRRFITTVGGGRARPASSAYLIDQLDLFGQGRARPTPTSTRRARRRSSRVLPQGADIRKIQADRERLEKDTDALMGTVGYKPADKWLVLPTVADPDLHYNKQIDGLQERRPRPRRAPQHRRRPEARAAGTVPGLARPRSSTTSRASASSRPSSGSRCSPNSSTRPAIARIEKIEIARPPKARTGADQRKIPFVTSIKVEMTDRRPPEGDRPHPQELRRRTRAGKAARATTSRSKRRRSRASTSRPTRR